METKVEVTGFGHTTIRTDTGAIIAVSGGLTLQDHADLVYLITAAPDLLAACERAAETYKLLITTSHPAHPDHELFTEEYHELKRAIAKAKGGE